MSELQKLLLVVTTEYILDHGYSPARSVLANALRIPEGSVASGLRALIQKGYFFKRSAAWNSLEINGDMVPPMPWRRGK